MEMRVNLVLLAGLAMAWAWASPSEPVPALDPDAGATAELADLEDAFARDRDNRALAQRLSEEYLEIDRPGLAIAALRSAPPELLEDPALAHRLAQAYEGSGRILDAMATADLALARCARSLGTAESATTTPVPRYECSARQYAALEVHHAALRHMARWGVADPRTDARVALAYDLAFRRARVASAE